MTALIKKIFYDIVDDRECAASPLVFSVKKKHNGEHEKENIVNS